MFKRWFHGQPVLTPTAEELDLPAEVMSIYMPGDRKTPPILAHWRDRCVKQMEIKQPPAITVLDDQVFEMLLNKANASYFDRYNMVCIPERMLRGMAEGNQSDIYVFCHEMGHAKQVQSHMHLPLNRRGFLTGMVASVVAGNHVGKAVGEDVAAAAGGNHLQREAAGAVGALGGGIGAAQLFHFSNRYYESLIPRAEEFYADRMAMKVLGAEYTLHAIGLQLSRLTLPFDVFRVDIKALYAENSRLLTARYGGLIDPKLLDNLAKLASFHGDGPATMPDWGSRSGSYPGVIDRVSYLLEEVRAQHLAQTRSGKGAAR